MRGIVQGVGFRPFVYRLAHSLALRGWVANTVHGVNIEVEGENGNLDRFASRLRIEAPPMARVASVRRRKIKPTGLAGFEIRRSKAKAGRTTYISPDVSVCHDCLAEMRDPENRRYRYPFINCTNCGPRYTIILDVPYDRPDTTMAAFTMCPGCRAEYENPLDRRFHAQPNACPVCGPRVWLTDCEGRVLLQEKERKGEREKGRGGEGEKKGKSRERDPIKAAGKLILGGAVVAVKGLGGFHLACDSVSEEAVSRLRDRKLRQDKPFAVMFPDLETVRKYCLVSPGAEKSLTGPERPIVLVPIKRRATPSLARQVAPFQDAYGAMLPYTPLHHLLMEAVDKKPLVMTSGNRSDEPIEIDNQGALERLSGIADYFLLHDRPIYMRADDSVVLPLKGRTFPIRRSRGYTPAPVLLREPLEPLLAVGGHLKNTICLVRGRDAFLSQHVGDLDRPDTFRFFTLTVEQLVKLFEVAPRLVAHDLHPDYLSTRWALSKSGLPTVGVQHHHAHVVSCMAEHRLSGRVLGLAMDGTGYGTDGHVWGGEFLVADEADYKRVGHLPYVPLPGAEAAIRETWRVARSLFAGALGTEKLDSLGLPLWERVGRARVEMIDRMIEKKLNCPLSSGCGRLFDAVAALLELRVENLYEGQAAIELETHALRASARKTPSYSFGLIEDGDSLIPDLTPMLQSIARDVSAHLEPGLVARGFHDCLIRMMVSIARIICERYRLERVVLSGGVFNNRYLIERLTRFLRHEGLRVFTHRLVPPGDGGLSLGQAVVASYKGAGL